MNVAELMTREVFTCTASDSLDVPAQLMFDECVGVVPVLGARGDLVGILTDRDVAMACVRQGAAPAALNVEDAMTRDVFTCRPDDSLVAAERVMRRQRVHRLPVVDHHGGLVGMLSFTDVVSVADWSPELSSREVIHTLYAVATPRPSERRG